MVLLNGNKIEEFDYENNNNKQLKGNVYLAKVTRVEPSLQAAFVEYGGNRQGFLAFSEIHPDYYRIPVEDREALEAEEAEVTTDDDEPQDEEGNGPVTLDGEDDTGQRKSNQAAMRRYKIQEVITRKQILLVQVVKEERGNKGAALTTYLSLAGRYCVLMPNSSRGGGVSRKITNVADRKRLKSVVGELDVPNGIAVIVRTAGSKRTKAEIKRDYSYLSKLWDEIRNKTLQSEAPSLINEEGSLVKRAIRDIYTNDVDEVLIEGDESYEVAKAHMKMLIPSHAKRVAKHEGGTHLFQTHKVEPQLDSIHQNEVVLKSGGYLVIDQTEALVAIDVNSGKATRERNIEETAVKTNLEAADELGRQLRLRDLSGLIVIDFIDMEDTRNQHAVERRLKDALRSDRARIQVGSISHFGLLEMSRQRLRPSLVESVSQNCPHCEGTGRVRSVNSSALQILRIIEDEASNQRDREITIYVHTTIALYVLNHKRASLATIEQQFGCTIALLSDDSLIAPDYRIDIDGHVATPQTRESQKAQANQQTSTYQKPRGNQQSRGNQQPRGNQNAQVNQQPQASQQSQASKPSIVEEKKVSTSEVSHPANEPVAPTDDDGQPKKRRRGRRGGRRRKKWGADDASPEAGSTEARSGEAKSGDSGDAKSTDSGPASDQASDASTNNVNTSQASANQASIGQDNAEKSDDKPDRNRRRRGKTSDKPQADAAQTDVPTEVNKPSDVGTTTGDPADSKTETKAKAPRKTAAKKPVAKKAEGKKAEGKKTRKKAAAKQPVSENASADTIATPAVQEKAEQASTARQPISSAAVDVVDVSDATPTKKKKGWWSRG